MLKTLLIFLLSLILAVGATFVMYDDEVDGMIQMGQDKIDEIINGEKPEPDGDGEQDELKVESIALDTTNVKLAFDFGEEFTTEGLKVTATLEDGSTKDVALADCKIVPVDTTKAGKRQVTIVYEGKSARYEITVNAKVIPPISETPLVDITAVNDSVPYRVEAELIDMAISGVVKAEGVDSFVAVAPEGADITSGDQYLTGFGVAWNYFGFTFTAAEKYENVIIVLRVANSTAKDLDAGIVKMFLNFAQDENGKASGAIALDGFIVEANGAGKWTDIVLRNVTIPEGTNTLTFETQKDNAFDIDYVDFYVGMRYINSVVEINDTTTIVKDLENFDTEKAFTRSDVANAHGLKDGQLFVEKVANESPGKTTSGGTSVGAIGKGSQMSTTIRLAQDSTIRIKFKASAVGKGAYNVADHWNFYIDGVKLTTVEVVNIEGGDAAASLWWDWKYTNVGEINLTAGDHFFLLEVHGTDCNVDTVEFEIVSLGSFDESGTNLEDMVQPEQPPVEDDSDLVINGKGDFVFEAEDLDISGLTPSEGQTEVGFEAPSGDGPATSGGQSLGKAGGGSASFTFTLEEKATIQIYGRLAHAHGGVASTFMSAALGETELALIGDLPVGEGKMPYWNWADIPFGGELELEAGTYTLTVTFLKNPNVDCFKIKVLSYGDEDADAPFATIEAETFDNEGVVTRQDMVDAGRIPAGEYMSENGNGATCICGFTAGTYFKLNLNLAEAMNLEMFLVGATDAGGYDVSTKLSLKVNGVDAVIPSGSITGAGDAPYWDWKTVSLGVLSLNAGDNEIIITILDGHPNLDKVFFVEAEEAPVVPEHSCESICSECGKCLDAECAEAACAEKCQGHQVVVTPDITITDASNKYKVEAEELDMSTLVPQAGFTAPVIESFDGGKGLGGLGTGGYQTFTVVTEKNVTVKLLISCAHAFGGSIFESTSEIYLNGEALTLIDNQIPAGIGTPQESVSNYYWNVADVHIATVDLVAGEVYTFKIMVKRGNLDGYALEVVENAPAHECESICSECGKCLDAECAEAACAEKCQGHVVVTPDLVIEGDGEFKFEAENVDKSNLVLRSDFAAAGRIQFTEGWSNDFGSGECLMAFTNGSKIILYVEVKEAATLALSFRMSFYETAVYDFSNITYTFAGQTLTPVAQGDFGHRQDNDYWKWVEVSLGEVTVDAGIYAFEMNMVSGGNHNLDYFKFVPVVAPAHECESACTACGKCTDSECAEAACESKCAGHDVIISDNAEHILEAENWPQDNMSARQDLIDANHPAISGNRLLENNGTTIGGMAIGSYVSFNVYVKEDTTVAFVMKAAHSLECIVNRAMTLTVDGVAVELCDKNILGSGSAPWFDWSIFTMGQADLSAGEHTIVLTFVELSPNIDFIKLVPVDESAVKVPETTDVASDITIATSGTTKFELETIDCSKCSIVTRGDFIPTVGAGNCGKGSGRIYGYADGSIFRVYVTVESACTLEIKLAGFGGTPLNAQSYTFGGIAILPADGAVLGNGAVAEGTIGQIVVPAAGVYCFEFTSGVNTDLDYVSFTVVE